MSKYSTAQPEHLYSYINDYVTASECQYMSRQSTEAQTSVCVIVNGCVIKFVKVWFGLVRFNVPLDT